MFCVGLPPAGDLPQEGKVDDLKREHRWRHWEGHWEERIQKAGREGGREHAAGAGGRGRGKGGGAGEGAERQRRERQRVARQHLLSQQRLPKRNNHPHSNLL